MDIKLLFWDEFKTVAANKMTHLHASVDFFQSS